MLRSLRRTPKGHRATMDAILVRTYTTTDRCTQTPTKWEPLLTLPTEWGIPYEAVEIRPRAFVDALPTIVLHGRIRAYNVRRCDEFSHENFIGGRKTRTRKDGITIAPYLLTHDHLHGTTYQEVWVLSKNGIIGLEVYASYLAAVDASRNKWPC